MLLPLLEAMVDDWPSVPGAAASNDEVRRAYICNLAIVCSTLVLLCLDHGKIARSTMGLG